MNQGSGETFLSARLIQYAVGHGGFHAGIIRFGDGCSESFVYVYDVGTKHAQTFLRQRIDNFLTSLAADGIQKIHAIFLSHIDADHVSGFEYLLNEALKRQIKVGKVYLPFLTTIEKILVGLKLGGRNSTVSEILYNPITVLSRYRVPELVFVREEGDFGRENENQSIADVPVAFQTKIGSVLSGAESAESASALWQLIPFRPTVDKSAIDDYRTLVFEATGKDIEDESTHNQLIESNSKQLRECLKAIDKKHRLTRSKHTISNWSSVVLYSSPRHNASFKSIFAITFVDSGIQQLEEIYPCNVRDGSKSGWLLTGDSPLDGEQIFRELQQTYRCLLEKTSVVLAPHHGSKNGHNKQLYADSQPHLVVINSGLSAKGKKYYGFPAQGVVSDLADFRLDTFIPVLGRDVTQTLYVYH